MSVLIRTNMILIQNSHLTPSPFVNIIFGMFCVMAIRTNPPIRRTIRPYHFGLFVSLSTDATSSIIFAFLLFLLHFFPPLSSGVRVFQSAITALVEFITFANSVSHNSDFNCFSMPHAHITENTRVDAILSYLTVRTLVYSCLPQNGHGNNSAITHQPLSFDINV